MSVDVVERQQRDQVTTIAEQRFEHYEHYQLWLHEKLLVDEVTDQAERLAAPMSHEFEYVLGPEGLMIELTADTLDGPVTKHELVRDVLTNGLRTAEERTYLHPEWKFEVERRRIELEEWAHVEALARCEVSAEALLVFSPHPDALNHGVHYIDGYNRERKKTMVRTITPSERGVRIRSTSLDQTNYQALQASIAALGYELPGDMSSEAILQQRYWIHEQPPEGYGWSDVARRAYDLSLTEQFGGEWYAGRRPIDVKDALAFIRQQPDLIEQHMQTIQQVMRSVYDRVEGSKILESHRYNFAAALDARLRGQEVENLSDAGDAARAEGKNFDRDCPTLETAEEQLATQGYGRKGEVLCNCPFCHKRVLIDPCAPHIICPECAAEVKDGKVVSRGSKEVRKALGKQAMRAMKQQVVQPQHKTADIKVGRIRRLPTGERALLQEYVGIGEAKQQWVNLENGEVLEIRRSSVAQAA